MYHRGPLRTSRPAVTLLPPMLRPLALLACALGLAPGACAGPSRRDAPADVAVLFMGNSHTSFHALPEMVAAMIRAVRPGQSVDQAEAPGWLFLDERSRDPASLALLHGRRWHYVVLQAQPYSASGRRSYSTAGAESLIRATRAVHAVPVLFPEWPRDGVAETRRIYDLHAAIASRAPACVAPVGQAWDLARALYPDLILHADDGNHAAPAGAFLAALTIAATITGASPEAVPSLPQFGVPLAVQLRLRAVAARTVAAVPPCPAGP